MARPLDTIVELQRALDELRSAEERLSGIPDWMRELHEEHRARKAEIEELEATATTAGREHRQAQGIAEGSQEKLKHFQEQINLVRTQKEYGAILQEIDTVKSQIKAAEDEALEALERQEKAEAEAREKREAFQELDRRYGTELAKWEAEKPGVARLAEELKGRIEVLRERLPPPVLAQFDRIFERQGGEALAPVRRVERSGKGPQIWHCGACNYRVRPQAVVDIVNHGSLVQCDSCKRILFVAEEPA